MIYKVGMKKRARFKSSSPNKVPALGIESERQNGFIAGENAPINARGKRQSRDHSPSPPLPYPPAKPGKAPTKSISRRRDCCVVTFAAGNKNPTTGKGYFAIYQQLLPGPRPRKAHCKFLNKSFF